MVNYYKHDLVTKAYNVCIKSHNGQKRKYDGQPYATHPIAVFRILEKVTHDQEILAAGLLHDTVEDTNITLDHIKKKFGNRVAGIVAECTADKNGNFNIQTKEGFMVKLADTLHNISTNPEEWYLQKKIKWHQEAGL